ncbi:MAG: response regulator [gamma proteobacterium symbiont of Phacoides pectinatus]
MSIRWKLYLTIVMAMLINLAVNHYAALTYKEATRKAAEIREYTTRIVTGALTSQVHFKKQVQEWKNILLRGYEPGMLERYQGLFEHEEAATRQRITALIELLEEGSAAIETARSFQAAHHRLGIAYRQALEAFDPRDPASHLEIDRRVRGINRQPSSLIDEVVASSLAYKDAKLGQLEEELALTERRILAALVGLLILTIFSFVLISNYHIARPIMAATRVARRIAAGDLKGEIPRGGRDEPGQLFESLRSMQKNLRISQKRLKHERKSLARRVKRRTRDLRFANEELARAAKAKDLFLATMSHELRTPLTTVLGLTEMLKDRLYGPLNDAQDKSLSTVEESSRHLLTLINDILDVAKVESGKMELKWDYIPVAQLVEASLRLVRQPAQKKSLQLESSIDPAISLIHGDSRRLKQVLVNLLGNAVKFTPAGGRIGLDVTLGENRKSVHLSVWDTGIGIEEGHQARLFEPFVQLDNEPIRRYSGTGLGLTLVNRLAQLHGGAIEVESHPGQGSRFTFSLPWKKARNLPEKVEIRGGTLDNDDTPPENLGRIHILLAEDNVANRGMISEFLRHQGLSVSIALDGPDVIRQATGGNPDIILMDIQLKELNGFEVTRELRRHPGLAQTPIIALTALAMPGDRERCLEAGMDDYLSKPMGLKELYRRILDFITDR